MLKIESHTLRDETQVDIISGFGTSYGIAFDRDKQVFIPDFKNGNFVRLSPDLARHEAFDLDGTKLVQAVVGQASSNNTADKPIYRPHEVSFDNVGNTYVTCYGAGWVAQISPDGSVIRRIGEEENSGSGLIQPVTTHFARDGFLYVGEYGNGRILRYTVDGELVGWLGAVDDGEPQRRFRTSGTPAVLSTPGALNNPPRHPDRRRWFPVRHRHRQ